MAEAAVEFLLQNLDYMLLHHANLVLDAKILFESLMNDLRLFKAFLMQSNDKTLRELIRDVVYEAEDVVDAFFTMAVVNESKKYFERAFPCQERLLILAKVVEMIRATVRNIYDQDKNRVDFASPQIHGGAEAGAEDNIPEEKKDPLVRLDDIVVFKNETETIIQYLTEESKELDVISIIGIPGLGITTLARKIFRDQRIRRKFPIRIWVYVSQEFRKRDVFLSILSKFTKITDDMYCMNDHDLVKLLRQKFERIKSLVVMDNVRTTTAWVELQDAFPKTNNRGKILITSHNMEVAREVSRGQVLRKLCLLTHVERWVLHQLDPSGKPKCPSDLVMLGRTLLKKASARDMSGRKHAGEKAFEILSTHQIDDPYESVKKIISSSYMKLPFHLKPCFLYLGMFPEDFEIPVQKLILMWIAEGFIQSKPGMSLEETAQDYLEDLIHRNLVMVDKMSSDGKIKTCRIHDALIEFCKNEAGNTKENFSQEMKMSSGGIFEPSISEVKKFRRLCIYSNVVSFITAKPFGPRVRSFLCFSKEEVALLPGNISSIPVAFKLLRVLEGQCIRFTKFPRDLTHLIHLRYLVLYSDFEVLPKVITKLWNLQTLIVGTTSHTLDINANIWKMNELRHLKINASCTLRKKGKSGGQKLQTLGTISPQSCTEEFFDSACGLKKLGIRGRIITLIDAGGFTKLVNLDKLKIVNDVFPLFPREGPLPYLPKPHKFPPKLRSLTLLATYLDWIEMSTLGMLDTLKVLKLKNNAFVGMKWEAVDGVFRHLEILHIQQTDLVVWLALGHHFPRLRCLALRNCEKLEAIPIGLAYSLQELVLDRVSKSASRSARKIQEVKEFEQGTETSERNGFKLYIAPGDE